MTTISDSKIIVALDKPDLSQTEILLKELQGVISWYKIGLELFTSCGWQAVDLVRRYGGRIFLDLKLNDIPNTVRRTSAVICNHGIEMFNVHALGGYEMMKAAREAVDEQAGQGKPKPALIAVTILTSHTENTLSGKPGIAKPFQEEVLGLALLAKKAGLDGVVSSAVEAARIRRELPRNFLIVTPGIREPGSPADDQKRTLSPSEAIRAGADYLVIGRPITAGASPKAAAEAIIASIH